MGMPTPEPEQERLFPLEASLPAPRRRSVLVVPCALLLLAVAAVVDLWPAEGLLAYEARSAPALVLGRDKITSRNAAFLRSGLLRMSHVFCEPHELAADSPEALALYKQPCPAPDARRLALPVPPSTALLPEVGAHPASALHGIAEISLVCHGSDLFDPGHGIVTHPLERGREAERPAWLTIRMNGRLVLESPVGLRVHGGHSRSLPHKSFAVCFREEHGGWDHSPGGLLFGPDSPPYRELVLANAEHPSRFNAALATQIAALSGCKTSRSVPAIVHLNGTTILSPFFVYEHQSPAWVTGRYGIRDMEWVRLKAYHEEDNEAYVAWRRWIRRPRHPILMKEEEARFDLKDLNAWVLAMTYTATGDNNQGAYFKDRKPGAVWQTVVWDMDWAFDENVHQTATGPVNYAQTPFDVILGDRARLFHRLFDHSTEYRAEFARYVQECLQGPMSQRAVMQLVEEYENLASRHPVAGPQHQAVMQKTRRFLEGRHQAYLRHLQNKLRQPLPVQGGVLAEGGPLLGE